LAPHAAALRDLAGVTLGGGAKPASAATAVVGGHELHVVLEGVLDVAKERERLDRELERVRKSVSFLEGRLGNEGFVARAPAALLEKSRAELAADRETLAKLETARAALA
jgi:valyl-tRNA synthetase